MYAYVCAHCLHVCMYMHMFVCVCVCVSSTFNVSLSFWSCGFIRPNECNENKQKQIAKYILYKKNNKHLTFFFCYPVLGLGVDKDLSFISRNNGTRFLLNKILEFT